MKESTKKEIKKGSIKGTSTAAGAIVGAMLEDAVFPETAEAQESEELEILDLTEGGNELPAEEAPVASTVEAPVADIVAEVEVVPEPAANTIHTTHTTTSHAPAYAEPEVAPEVAVADDAVEVIDSVAVEDDTDLDDIEVVSVGTDDPDVNDVAVVDAGYDAPEAGDIPDYMDAVDYTRDNVDQDLLASRADGADLGSADLAQEMPDYVNDANIDSFMGMA